MKYDKLLDILKSRFEDNMNRHEGLSWEKIQKKIEANPKIKISE